jgi:hypothetical protein
MDNDILKKACSLLVLYKYNENPSRTTENYAEEIISLTEQKTLAKVKDIFYKENIIVHAENSGDAKIVTDAIKIDRKTILGKIEKEIEGLNG